MHGDTRYVYGFTDAGADADTYKRDIALGLICRPLFRPTVEVCLANQPFVFSGVAIETHFSASVLSGPWTLNRKLASSSWRPTVLVLIVCEEK